MRRFAIMAALPALLLSCSDDDTPPLAEAGMEAGVDVGVPDGPGAETAQDMNGTDSTPDPDGTVGDGGGSLDVQGTLSGTGPAKAKVLAIWGVSAGSPDYSYKYGEGTATASGFSLQIPGAPPAEALNNGHFGLALLVLVSDTLQLPDGKITDTQGLDDAILGGAEQHVLIYRPATLPGQVYREWIKDFPPGLSCGVASGTSGSFVDFAPTDCTKLEITVSAKPDFPNWT